MTRGMTSGCWNLLHPGHINFLYKCKRLCDVLYVGVARDKITKNKRVPVMNEEQRKYMLENTNGSGTEVFLEEEKMPPENLRKAIRKYKPHFYFTNDDNPYIEKLRKMLKEEGVNLVMMEREPEMKGIFNVSTTQIIKKIQSGKYG